MLVRSQATLVAYEEVRGHLAHALGDQSCLDELSESLRSLERHCLTDLDIGLQAVVDGDLTRGAQPVTRPLKAPPDARLGELGEIFNTMLARSRTALYSYNSMREDLRVSLGDRSCLEELRQRLTSLYRHCLRDLDEGLEAVASGTDITREVMAVTPPITAEDERDLGELAEVFNRMLARAQSSLGHYDELRRRETGH
jgi:methyl-accepting chemotaxis protein